MPGNSNSGKRPKPNALRVLEGMRGHRPLRDEPKFPPVAPVCPDWMPALGREIWEKLTDKLGRVPGWLSDSDFLVMERIGVAYARWRTYEAFIDVNGPTQEHEQHYIDESGTPAFRTYPKARPEVAMARAAAAEVDRLMSKLGISPSDRARLAMPSRSGADDSDIDAARRSAR